MRDLMDTLAGLLGAVIFAWTYTQQPVLAFAYVGFHIGVSSMRATRARKAERKTADA